MIKTERVGAKTPRGRRVVETENVEPPIRSRFQREQDWQNNKLFRLGGTRVRRVGNHVRWTERLRARERVGSRDAVAANGRGEEDEAEDARVVRGRADAGERAAKRFGRRLERAVESGREEVTAVVSAVFGRPGGAFVEVVEG